MINHAIHPTAIIDATAELGEGVEIGPYSVIGPHVSIGDYTQIEAHVNVKQHTHLGKHCKVMPGTVLGGPPQDLGYKGEPTRVSIGDNAIIHECVTVHRASGENKTTQVGNNALLMAYSHVGHNGQVGNNVILANGVQLGGHVQVDDYAFIGGGVMIHQHVRIGKMVMMAGASAARQDLTPFSTNEGIPCNITGLNIVGMRRRNINPEERRQIKKAFSYLFYSGLNLSQALQAIDDNLPVTPYIREIVTFVSETKRGIVRPPRRAYRLKGVDADDNMGLKDEEEEASLSL